MLEFQHLNCAEGKSVHLPVRESFGKRAVASRTTGDGHLIPAGQSHGAGSVGRVARPTELLGGPGASGHVGDEGPGETRQGVAAIRLPSGGSRKAGETFRAPAIAFDVLRRTARKAGGVLAGP